MTDEEGLRVRSAVGLNHEYFLDARTADDASRTLHVAREGRSYLGEFLPEDLLMTRVPTGPWTPLRTAIIVPIVHQGRVLGTINIYHSQENAFGEHDRELL